VLGPEETLVTDDGGPFTVPAHRERAGDGQAEAVRLLLARGADPSARDALGRFEARFPAMRLSVKIGTSAPIEILQAYGDARKGVPLATFGSFELLEIAVRDGSAAQRFAAGPGAIVTVRPARRTARRGS